MPTPDPSAPPARIDATAPPAVRDEPRDDEEPGAPVDVGLPSAGDQAAARARLRRRARRVALRATLFLVVVSLGAASVAAFLLRWATGSGTDTRVIAVAPFDVRSDDPPAPQDPGDSAPDSAVPRAGDRRRERAGRRASADARLLREGMLDLLAARLTGEDGPRVTDPRALLARWRRAAPSDSATLTRERARGVARALNAGRLIVGEVTDAGARRLRVDATLVDVNDGRALSTARVDGSLDSLPALVDRLAVRLLAASTRLGGSGSAVGAGTSLAVRATASAPALRAYLAARAAARRSLLRESVAAYAGALAHDSAFALAAVEMASVAAWLDDSAAMDRGIRLAWRERARLSRQDRALLEAKTGPRWPAEPTRAELVASKERYARVAPERAESWAEAGDGLFHLGPAVGAADAHARAASAFRRALALDPSLAPALEHLALLVARDVADSSASHRAEQIASDALALGEPAGRLPLLRWRIAALRDDDALLDSLARAGGSLDWPVARLIALSAAEDGGPAASAAALLGARLGSADGAPTGASGDAAKRGAMPTPVSGVAEASPSQPRAGSATVAATITDLRLAHDLAVGRGRSADAERTISEIQRIDGPLARRMRAMDAIFGDGDTVTASQSVRQLTLRTDRPPTSITDQAAHVADVCVVALWRSERGDPRGDADRTRSVVAWLRNPAAPPPTPDSAAMANAERSQAARTAMATRRRGRGARAVFRTPPADSVALDRRSRWRQARSTVARREALACAIVLDASAARARRMDLRRPAERLDSLLRFAAPGTLADDVGPVLLARLLARTGDRRDALAALRRRPYLYGLPGYVATSLREEAALAERARDRQGAARAWRRYAMLRANADAPLRPDVARAWLEVRRLEAR